MLKSITEEFHQFNNHYQLINCDIKTTLPQFNVKVETSIESSLTLVELSINHPNRDLLNAQILSPVRQPMN
jgi:hypothetical protein